MVETIIWRKWRKRPKRYIPSISRFLNWLTLYGTICSRWEENIIRNSINVEQARKDIIIESDEADLDGLNYLAGKGVDYVNHKALQGTVLAHNDGQVPNMILNIEKLDIYNFGYMAYFFMKACGLSGYLLGVNPFNQPGVEA